MTALALSKSSMLQRTSPPSRPGGSGSAPSLPTQSVQATGMSDRLPSGSTASNSGTALRVSVPMTARRRPSKACRLRVTMNEASGAWRWVVCGVVVRHGPWRPAASAL